MPQSKLHVPGYQWMMHIAAANVDRVMTQLSCQAAILYTSLVFNILLNTHIRYSKSLNGMFLICGWYKSLTLSDYRSPLVSVHAGGLNGRAWWSLADSVRGYPWSGRPTRYIICWLFHCDWYSNFLTTGWISPHLSSSLMYHFLPHSTPLYLQYLFIY